MSTEDAKIANNQEFDLLKCVIKVLMKPGEKEGIDRTGKMRSIPWVEVAGYMNGEFKPETIRKKWDKVSLPFPSFTSF